MVSVVDMRKKRIEAIFGIIKNNNEVGTDKGLLVANCCLEFGVTARLIREYLTILLRSGRIKLVADDYFINSKAEI